MDVIESVLRSASLIAGTAVLLCFPVIWLFWPSGAPQVVQTVFGVMAMVLASVYLIGYRHEAEERRRAVRIVLLTTSVFIALELIGVVITSVSFD